MTPQSDLMIGINGGGTHTSMVLADRDLNVLARSEVGPSNPTHIGYEAVRGTIAHGVELLLQEAGVTLDRVGGFGAGLAGVDRPADSAAFQDIFAALYPGKHTVIDNDALVALVAGVGRRFGIVTISGTGMIALGEDGQGKRARSGGWGHYTDYGSGYWIAREVLHSIAQADDGSGEATALTDAVLHGLGLRAPSDLIPWAYAPNRHVREIAGLARYAVQQAISGDRVARRIIAAAADSLAGETVATARKLGFGEHPVPFPVLLSGSLFKYSALLRELFGEYVAAVLPNAVMLHREHEAALGGAILAFDAAGIPTPAANAPFGQPSLRRATERRNPLTMDSVQASTLDFLTAMNIEDGRVAGILAGALPRIAALIEAIAPRFEAGGRVFQIGAGTSGRLAILDASECKPTFDIERIIGVIAGGERAIVHSLENAEDSEEAAARDLAPYQVGPNDTLIGIAASGSTPYVRGALLYAATRHALTACIVNNAGGPLIALADHPIVLATGPEALTGSTRLKSGTAQKLALNLISTGLMHRVGRIYGNLMTHMLAGNAKLRDRAVQIVGDAADIPLERARDLLAEAEGDMSLAIAAALLNLPVPEAALRLKAANGNLARAVAG